MAAGRRQTWARRIIVISCVVILAVVAIGVPVWLNQREIVPIAPVTLCLGVQPQAVLLLIALENGYFADEGVAVAVKEHVSGKRAFLAMEDGECDLSNATGVVAVSNSFKRHDYKVLAGMGSLSNMFSVVARDDRGILQPSDLKGKHVATQRASAVHFFMYVYLLRHGLLTEELKISFKRAEELPAALANGEIDASFMREPFVGQAKELLAGKVAIFQGPGAYDVRELLIGRDNYIQDNPAVVVKMLKALLRAQDFVVESPDMAIRIVAQRLGARESEVAASWPDSSFELLLDQALLVGMEDQARWIIKEGFTDEKEVPNFLDHIYAEALAEAKPEAVTMIQREVNYE